MNCATCKVNKIGPKTAPYGGYLCPNEHLQCKDCNAKTSGVCGICEEGTNFVQMNFNTLDESLFSPLPTAPSMTSEGNLEPVQVNSSYVFPKSFFADIETQSSISQEHLSMHESRETIDDRLGKPQSPRLHSPKHISPRQNSPRPDVKPLMLKPDLTKFAGVSSAVPVKFNPAQARCQMETIYFGGGKKPPQQQHHNSISNFTIPYVLENGVIMSGEHPKEEPKFSFKLAVKNLKENEIKDNGSSIREDGKEKGAKDAPEEIEDPHVIHTSEIRFMESTESLKNYYSGGTVHPTQKAKPEHPLNLNNQQESLSVKMLHDFECQNTANPADLVEFYLRSYGPLALCHFPAYAYSFNHSCFHENCENWTAQQRQAAMRSICVSTESEPSLVANGVQKKLEMPAKYLPPDFFMMKATGVPEPTPGTIPDPGEKSAEGPSIDIRMQKVLETFQEDPRQQQVSEKPLLEQQPNKIPATVIAGATTTTETTVMETAEASAFTITTQTEEIGVAEVPDRCRSNEIATEVSNSHRAYYNPPMDSLCPLNNHTSTSRSLSVEPPPPQFQIISCTNILGNDLILAKARYFNLKPISANLLNIPRSPIQCPESSCKRMIFVSDFNKHLIVDHSKLPMERIAPRQCKNFFIDPRLSHNGISKCHLLYLIRDKIKDLGSSKFKDFLPMLVMSTRVRLSDLCGVASDSQEHCKLKLNDVEFLLIWLTGIVPEEFPVSVSLTVWPRSGRVPNCHLVHSGEMYSIRKSQSGPEVCQSGQLLLLSANEVQLLTNNGKEMLELQIVVH